MPSEHPSNTHISGLSKSLLIVLLALLSCYYLWVLYLAATPKVTPAYQTYYINTQTLYWGKDNHRLVIDKQQQIDVTTKNPFMSREGWESVAKDNQRGLSNNGGLYFSFADPQVRGFKLQLKLAKLPHQSVSVTAKFDGQSVTEFTWLDQQTLQAEFNLNSNATSDTIHHLQFLVAEPLSVSNISLTSVEHTSSVFALNQG